MNKNKSFTTTLSSKGQLTIPSSLRKKLSLGTGTKFVVSESGNGLELTKLPTNQEWHDILNKYVPKEKVDIDAKGHYDPKKSPHFDKWMRSK